uniref:Uncharacterized protein n=1 Tax=Anguilla anguilla TaxID=7936 RepID=A0A0E9RNM4_ANGAN
MQAVVKCGDRRGCSPMKTPLTTTHFPNESFQML